MNYLVGQSNESMLDCSVGSFSALSLLNWWSFLRNLRMLDATGLDALRVPSYTLEMHPYLELYMTRIMRCGNLLADRSCTGRVPIF